MNETIIDATLISLGIDTAKLQAGFAAAIQSLEKVNKAAAKSKNEVEKTGTGASNAGKSFYDKLIPAVTKTIAVLGGLKLVLSSISNYLSAQSVKNFSSDLGENMETVQAWRLAVEQAGGSAAGFDSSLASLAGNIANATVNGDYGAFERINVRLHNLDGSARKASDVMLDLADSFQKMSVQEAIVKGSQLGLDNDTVRLLSKGRSAVASIIEEQRKFVIYTEEDAKAATKAKNSFNQMTNAMMSLGAIAMRVIVPALSWIASMLTSLARWAQENKPFFIAFVVGFAAILTTILLPALIQVGIAMAAAFFPVLAIGAAVAAVAGIIALLIDDFVAWSEGGGSVFGAIWEKIDPLIKKIKELWNALKPVREVILSVGKAFASFAANSFIDILRLIITAVGSFINILVSAVSFIIKILKGDFAGAWDEIKNIILSVFDVITGVVDNILGFFSNIGKFWRSIFGDDEIQEGTESKTISNNDVQISAAEAITPSAVTTSRNIRTDTKIDKIVINTQATDAEAIASDMSQAIDSEQKDIAYAFERGTF